MAKAPILEKESSNNIPKFIENVKKGPNCKACAAKGLAILPVRYAVVPKKLKVSIPSWAAGKKSAMPELGAEFGYGLRLIREGFIYLYYGDGILANQWQCYRVNGDGLFWLQNSIEQASADNDAVFKCNTPGHQAGRLEHIVILDAANVKDVWIAFSEFKWSSTVCDNYVKDKGLRDRHMQLIHPQQWVSPSPSVGGAPASAANLSILESSILEYSGAAADYSPTVDQILNLATSETQENAFKWKFPDDVARSLAEKRLNAKKSKLEDERKKQEAEAAALDADKVLKEIRVVVKAKNAEADRLGLSARRIDESNVSMGVGIALAKWSSEHAAESCKADIAKIERQLRLYDRVSLSGESKAGEICKLNQDALARVSTLYPWVFRNSRKQSMQTIHFMKERMVGMNAEPMVLALADPVGLVHELNGFCNEAAGKMRKFQEEIQISWQATLLLDGLKARLDARYLALCEEKFWFNSRQKKDIEKDRKALDLTVKLKGPFFGVEADLHRRYREFYEFIEQLGERRVQYSPYVERVYDARRHLFENKDVDPVKAIGDYDKKLAALKREIDEADKRIDFKSKYKKELLASRDAKVADAYKDAMDGIDSDCRKVIRNNKQASEKEISDLVEARVKVLLAQVSHRDFLQCLSDAGAGSNAFRDLVGGAIAGINGSAVGSTQFQKWMEEAQSGFTESNMLLLAITAGNKKIDAEIKELFKHLLDDKLKQAAPDPKQWASDASKSIDYTTNVLKTFAGVSIDARKIFIERQQKVAALAPDAIQARNDYFFLLRRGDDAALSAARRNYAQQLKKLNAISDRGLATVANWMRGAFANPSTHAQTRAEVTVGVFLALAEGAHQPPKVAALFKTMAKQLPQDAERWSTMLHAARNKSPQERMAVLAQVTRESSEKAKQYFGERAGRLERIGLGANAVLEMANLGKLCLDCYTKGDFESGAMLAASVSGLIGYACDWRTLVVGEQAPSYIGLKAAGALFASASGLVGAGFDLSKTKTYLQDGHYGVAALYGIKAIGGGVQVLGVIGGVFDTAAKNRVGGVLINRAVGSMAGEYAIGLASNLSARVFVGLSLGGWLTVVLFAVQGILWVVEPGPLEDWCRHCGIGKKRDKNTYDSNEAQVMALEQVLEGAS